MADPAAPARSSLSALLPMLIGNLVAVSALALPLVPASIAISGTLVPVLGTRNMQGTRIIPLSAWQILTFPAPQPARLVMVLQQSSYVALAPVAFALLALLAIPSVLISHFAPSWLSFYRVLAICGLLSLLLAAALALLSAQVPPINALALGIALVVLCAAFLAMIVGGTLAPHRNSGSPG